MGRDMGGHGGNRGRVEPISQMLTQGSVWFSDRLGGTLRGRSPWGGQKDEGHHEDTGGHGVWTQGTWWRETSGPGIGSPKRLGGTSGTSGGHHGGGAHSGTWTGDGGWEKGVSQHGGGHGGTHWGTH